MRVVPRRGTACGPEAATPASSAAASAAARPVSNDALLEWAGAFFAWGEGKVTLDVVPQIVFGGGTPSPRGQEELRGRRSHERPGLFRRGGRREDGARRRHHLRRGAREEPGPGPHGRRPRRIPHPDEAVSRRGVLARPRSRERPQGLEGRDRQGRHRIRELPDVRLPEGGRRDAPHPRPVLGPRRAPSPSSGRSTSSSPERRRRARPTRG